MYTNLSNGEKRQVFSRSFIKSLILLQVSLFYLYIYFIYDYLLPIYLLLSTDCASEVNAKPTDLFLWNT